MNVTSKQKQVAALWAQNYSADEIAEKLSVKRKAIYKLLDRIKRNDPDAHERMETIRSQYKKAKKVVENPRLCGDMDRSEVKWYDNVTGRTDYLEVCHQF